MAERSRRNTLTAVSSSSLNSRTSNAASSRASLAPSKARTMVSSNSARFSISSTSGGCRSNGAKRPSMGANRPSMGRPSTGRPSMAAGERKSSTGVRRSTTYGGSSGTRSDPRPLMDKTFLNASFHKLADYLSSHGYDQPINAKTLSRPSGRDFNNIMGFLFRQIDPNYKPSGRFEDDVIPFLKMLRYPFALSRSSLAAVGAPQTWPKVMGAISWIVDTLLFEEAVAAAEEEQNQRRQQASREDLDDNEDEDDDQNEQVADLKEFIDYLGDGYSYFLEGDDDAFSALTEDYINAREVENARAEEISKGREGAIEHLSQQIQELKKEGESLPQLEEGLAQARFEKEKYVALEEQFKTYKDKLIEKTEKRKEEERKLKEALDIIRESHVALREQIARQEFSAEDVEQHLAERRRVKEALKKATEAKTKARKEGWTAQEEALRHKEMLEEALEAYKTKAEALLLIPNGSQPAKNGGDINFEISLEEDKLHEEGGILSNDVHGVIRPGLNQLKVAIMRRTQGLREELNNLRIEEDRMEEEITDIENELEVVKKQVKLKETTYMKEKQALDQKVVAMKRGLEDEERRLASSETAEDLDRLTAEEYETSDVLRLEIEALKEKQEVELKQSENLVHCAIEMALDYKEREEKCLAGLKERYRQHLAAVEHGETSFDIVLANDGKMEDEASKAKDLTKDEQEGLWRPK